MSDAADSQDPTPALDLQWSAERSRYEGRLEGELATVIDVSRRGDVWDVTHTGTEPAFRGRGLAGEATRLMLDDVRSQGARVVAYCPFTASYLDQHPDQADLRA